MKQLGAFSRPRKIQYELCLLFLYIYDFLFGSLGGDSWKAPEGSLTSSVHEWGNWERRPKPTTLWWGGLASFLVSGLSCLLQLTASCGNEVIKGWGRDTGLSFHFLGVSLIPHSISPTVWPLTSLACKYCFVDAQRLRKSPHSKTAHFHLACRVNVHVHASTRLI